MKRGERRREPAGFPFVAGGRQASMRGVVAGRSGGAMGARRDARSRTIMRTVARGDPGPLHPRKSPLYLTFPGDAGLQDVLFDNRV